MKRYVFILIAVLMYCVAFGQKSSSKNAKTTTIESSFEAPDFNYPQTVIADADIQLKKALKDGNGETVALALIQTSLAQSKISADTLPTIIKNVEQVQHKISNPSIKAILYLLDAQILNTYYNRNKYKKISRRNNLLPATSLNILEWDAKQFKVRISELLDSALSYKKDLCEVPITTYPKLVKINDASVSTYPTMFDFIGYRSIGIYNSWGYQSAWNPFVRTQSSNIDDYENRVVSIFDDMLSIHQVGSRAYLKVLLSRMDYTETNTKERLDSLYNVYENNPDVAMVVQAIVYMNKDSKENYSLLQSYLKRFPNNEYKTSIELQLRFLERPKASVSFKDQYTSADSITLTCTAENTHKFTVSLYNVPNGENVQNSYFEKNAPIHKKDFFLTDSLPFSDTISISMPPVPFGRYTATITAYDDNGKQLEQTRSYYSTFIVSDITSFKVANIPQKTRRIYAVNAITGAPNKNVTITSKTRGKNPLSFSASTNAKGYIEANDTRFSQFSFNKVDDKFFSASIYQYFYDETADDTQKRASIFTDLAIYRPGETVHTSAVCYEVNTTDKKTLSNHAVCINLYDSNNDSITSVSKITDEMGRITHDFILPTDRLNGDFRISITDEKTKKVLANKNIVVSEYKTPSFYIEFIDTKSTYSNKGEFTLKGVAKTFNGIPLGSININCALSYATLWREFTQLSSFDLKTDENGVFSVTLNASLIKAKEESSFTIYKITATGTDMTGETQSGNTIFNLGSAIVMQWNATNSKLLNLDVTKEATLPISIKSNDINAPSSFPCTLTLSNLTTGNTDTIAFNSAKPQFDFSHLVSGEYSLNVWVNEDSTVRIKDKTIALFRPDDKESPVASALWTPFESLSCAPGVQSEILLGNTYSESYVYYVINYKNKILEEGWRKLPKGMSKLKYTMPEDAVSNLLIQLYCIKGLTPYNYDIVINVEKEKKETALTVESFRDRITAGEKEKWTLKFTENQQPIAGAAIMGVLTDKAINKLQENKWYFNPKLISIYTQSSLLSQGRYWGGKSNIFSWNTGINDFLKDASSRTMISVPQLNLYDQSFFSENIRIRGSKSAVVEYASSTVALGSNEQTILYKDNQDAGAIMEESTSDEAGKESLSVDDLTNIPLRASEIKTAFWKPMLVTDENGNVNIEFTVPDFNTTWMFQAIGYSKDLETASLLKDVISNKPIMVSPNMPRFLRQGDTATLMASVQNAGDSAQSCIAVIDIINPFNNQIYETKSFNLDIASSASQAVSIEYAVPDTVSAIGFRIKASNGVFSDGEQVIVPVLQAISPIIETKPFYIEKDVTDYTLELPKFTDGARITLEYCNNPIWYVATALPAINENEKTTATQLAHSIFANLIANKIANDNPIIQQAISYWKQHPQDSALISMLEKNQDLKINTLLASPWLKESEAQTLRMSQLEDLFNNAKSASATAKLIEKLAELQMSNGGFTWYKYNGAYASLHTTLTVLQLIGEAKSLGAIGNNSKLNDIAQKAVTYIDKQLIEQYNKQKDKLNFSTFNEYAYVRSLFLDIPMSVTVNNFYGKIIQAVSKDWKKQNIMNKAYSALTLANFGKTEQALPIIESINQFSIYSPATGRYWDNYRNGWYEYCDKVTLTSLILQAYSKVTPEAEEIAQIRQWMLLQKQTTDWGNSSLAADAVYAILATDSKQLAIKAQPEITLNGKTVEFSSLDKILGYGKVQLDVNNVGKDNKIEIKRASGDISWGAVYCQYNAPMSTVKAASVSQLSITKEITSYSNSASLKVGDKVQIRLVIKNSQALDFVTVADERAACLEPVEQISEYRFEDGTGYYMEIKDSKTNLFFNNLQKGTHVFTYDAYVTNSGTFNSGVATVQCQYAPQITAHSAGTTLEVNK